MANFLRPLLLLTLILAGCSRAGFSLEASPTSPATEPVPTLDTPRVEQPPADAITDVPPQPQECGYQWAYQDLPALSSNFLRSIQAFQSEAQATAFAFGENCVHSDGSATFIPMETDFNVTLQVPTLADEAALGEWIVKVMQVIESIPAEQIIGPRPGRVSILFASPDQQGGVNFYIDQYRDLAAGLSEAEIYQALRSLK